MYGAYSAPVVQAGVRLPALFSFLFAMHGRSASQLLLDPTVSANSQPSSLQLGVCLLNIKPDLL